MRIEVADLDRLAKLSRLALDSEQRTALAGSITDVLEMMAVLVDINVDAVAPMAHPHDATLRLRSDKVSEINLRDQLEAIAPEMQGGLYLVPKVME